MTSALTVRDLFLSAENSGRPEGRPLRDSGPEGRPLRDSGPEGRPLRDSIEDAELSVRLQLPAVPTGLSHLVTEFEWRGLAERVGDLLDINVVDVLLAGWKKHDEVRTQLRVTAVDPSRTVLVYIGHHIVDSTHTPSIELRSHGRRVVELSFPIELKFEIAAIELTLRAGAITEIRSGEVKARGSVKLESAVILERELSPLRLPDKIVLDSPPLSAEADETLVVPATVM
jgi:hypothetical protein